MSLGPVIIREPGAEDVTAAERLIYAAFIAEVTATPPTSYTHAVLRARTKCGVSRRRVLDVIRKVNAELDITARPL